jgi:hypothetical protein
MSSVSLSRSPSPDPRRGLDWGVSLPPQSSAPRIAWPSMLAYLQREFKQGDHAAIIGPTGSGKTHIGFELANIRSYVMVVACKPKDPLIDHARSMGYWLVPGNKLEIPHSDGKPVHRRVIYWPRLSEKDAKKLKSSQLLAAEKAIQRPAVGGAIGYVRRNGHWCIVIDEGTWVCRDLGLQRDVDSALFQFRTLDSSIIIMGQRPSWMGRYVLSSPTHLFLFSTNDTNDRKSLGEISGVDTKLVQELVRQLDFRKHESLYINTRTREMFITIAPPR